MLTFRTLSWRIVSPMSESESVLYTQRKSVGIPVLMLYTTTQGVAVAGFVRGGGGGCRFARIDFTLDGGPHASIVQYC